MGFLCKEGKIRKDRKNKNCKTVSIEGKKGLEENEKK